MSVHNAQHVVDHMTHKYVVWLPQGWCGDSGLMMVYSACSLNLSSSPDCSLGFYHEISISLLSLIALSAVYK